MPDPFTFDLVSPEKLLLSEDVEMVVVPGAEGDFGVLVGHAPLISALRPGVIDTYSGTSVDKRIFVAGGFAEVTGERCTVLAEEAVPVSDIDTGEAASRLSAAREAVGGADSETARSLAETELSVAESMVEAAKGTGA
ncbi:MAG: F0F1 ATP synthase subunit epsilon [Pseudomonadota bacterium]|jgi:F-type H+-transporting ATPase subunit epsilon|nr:F0F1 ATP synthase subunit epsilon [Rhodospirillaceae bacterium]MEE2720289.1 F0F1 ATP synthase subunit epsilon [Pseudomonadota bacterium]|tara:strand:- start:3120 stop:3533 length:414 start_codon:yes stop_codon:yes gene_type:complete